MTSTASGYIFAAVGYLLGWRQAVEDLADSAEDVILEAGTPRFADAAARTAAIPAPVLGMKAVLTSDEITYRYNGSAWKGWESNWTSYTPTLTGWAIGTGGVAALTGHYRYAQGRVQVRVSLFLGTSGASVTGNPARISLPVSSTALQTSPQIVPIGGGSLFDTSAATAYRATIYQQTSAGVTDIVVGYAGTVDVLTAITGAGPFTWAAGDSARVEAEYDPA
jgi:hypothetical protein